MSESNITNVSMYIKRISMWVIALREPDRKQTTGELQNERGMCCLGVACAIAPLDDLGIRPKQVPVGEDGFFVSYNGMTGTIPRIIHKWYGFTSYNPHLRVPDWLSPRLANVWREATAISLNDSYHFSFLEISDCVVHTYGLEESLGFVTKP